MTVSEVTAEAEEPLLAGEQRIDLRRYASNAASQLALVGSNVCPIESLDYESIENDFSKQDWRGREWAQMFEYFVLKWILCFLVGGLAGCVGFFNNLAVENIAGVKFVVTSNMMLANKYAWAFGVFAVSNFVLAMFACVITTYIAPEAAGSGIPEVKAYLNGVDAPGIFSLRTLVIKVVGSITVVSSSLHVGKAGPMVHTAACIASLLGQGGSRKYHLTCKWLRYLENDKDRRDLISCGAGAGVAAAFRAPVGGILFALETVSSWWTISLLWRAFFTTAIVAVVLRLLIDICKSDKCGLFGKGGLIMFDISSDNVTYHLVDLPPVIVLGVVGGILGSLYNFLLIKVLRVYNLINKKGHMYKLLLAASLSIFTSCCLFGLPWLASCRPCPDGIQEECPSIGRSGNFKKFQCTPHSYNDLASLFFNTKDDVIRYLFSAGTDVVFQKSSILLFFVTSYLLGILSYGVVAPTGLFIPVILTGATYGRLVGMLMGSNSTLDHGLFAVLGSASLLGGTMRMTVWATLSSRPCGAIYDAANGQRCGHGSFANLSWCREDEFAKRGSGKGDSVDDIELTAEEMEMFIDLHPFANTSPYTVIETMSLAKAIILFREVGLRHLLVVPKSSSMAPVVGILTRHDFMPEHILGLHPFLMKSRWKKLRFRKSTLIKLFSALC